jgi:hypothetical protein
MPAWTLLLLSMSSVATHAPTTLLLQFATSTHHYLTKSIVRKRPFYQGLEVVYLLTYLFHIASPFIYPKAKGYATSCISCKKILDYLLKYPQAGPRTHRLGIETTR